MRREQFSFEVPSYPGARPSEVAAGVYTIELQIDETALIKKLAWKAILSKGGRAIEAGGGVVVKVIKRPE